MTWIWSANRNSGANALWDDWPVLSSAAEGDGVNDRALFILDKLIKRDTPEFQAAGSYMRRLGKETAHARFSPMRLPGAHGS